MKNTILCLIAVIIFIPVVSFASAVMGSAGASAGNITNGLVGWWTFDGRDIANTFALDKSGNNFTGTLTSSPTKLSGKSGQALKFNGSSSYVSVADSATLRPTSVTVSAWVRQTSTPSGRSAMVGKWFNSNVWGYSVEAKSESGGCSKISGVVSKFYFRYRAAADSLDRCAASNVTPVNNHWYHVVASYDQTSGTASIYVNGLFDNATTSTAGSALQQPVSNLGVGAIHDAGTFGSYFPGTVDDVRIYNRALSANEVYSLYQYGNAKLVANAAAVSAQSSGSGLVGWWTFDGKEITTTAVLDKSTTGASGTRTNGPISIAGKTAQAMSFDGSNDYVAMPAAAQTTIGNLTSNFSLSAWIKPKTLSGIDRIVVHSVDVSSGGFGFGTNGTGLRFTTFGVKDYDTTTVTLVKDKWYYVTAVMDSDFDTSFYVDGAFREKILHTAAGNANTDDEFLIGSHINAAGAIIESFDGVIDDVRVYNRALSADEVYNLFKYNDAKQVVNASAVSAQATKSGLVGWWTFDGKDMTATAALDRSGSGNVGTLTSGPTKRLGKIGQSLFFDASDDKVTASASGSLDLGSSDSVTISAWIYPKSFGGGSFGRIFDKAGTGATTGYTFFVRNDGSGANTISGGIGAVGGLVLNTNTFIANDNILSLNKWQHVVMTFDTGANTMNFYRDGRSVRATASISTNITSGNTVLGVIGGRDGDTLRQFDGQIDDIRVYNRALSADEIYSLYLYGK